MTKPDNIEAAWDDIDDACNWSLRTLDDEEIEVVVTERLAVHALALAVLDEAFTVPVLIDSIYVARRDVDKLRAHIKTLGTEETEDE